MLRLKWVFCGNFLFVKLWRCSIPVSRSVTLRWRQWWLQYRTYVVSSWCRWSCLCRSTCIRWWGQCTFRHWDTDLTHSRPPLHSITMLQLVKTHGQINSMWQTGGFVAFRHRTHKATCQNQELFAQHHPLCSQPWLHLQRALNVFRPNFVCYQILLLPHSSASLHPSLPRL